jgi:purine-binding chemotaxis protein CheW
MATTDSQLSALVFKVAGAGLALRVRDVRELLPAVALQAVPEMPPLLRGFVAIGRELIPILRLEQLLRLQNSPNNSWEEDRLSNQIVLIHGEGHPLGWTCGSDSSVIRIAAGELVRLPPGHSLNDCAEFVIARPPPEQSIVLLEPRRLLLEKERVCLEELRTRAAERISAIPARQ